MTAVAEEDVTTAFNAALAQDAGTPAAADGPAAPAPPPRKPEADGDKPARPARKPRPAKPDKDSAPRTAPAATAGADARDYTDDLMGLGANAWFCLSAVRGGKILGIPVPDTRPYAAVLHSQLPQLARAWNAAAQQNSTVRQYVEKWSGDGSPLWMLGVVVTGVQLVTACAQIAQAPAEVRAQVAEQNDAMLAEVIAAQAAAAGLTNDAA